VPRVTGSGLNDAVARFKHDPGVIIQFQNHVAEYDDIEIDRPPSDRRVCGHDAEVETPCDLRIFGRQPRKIPPRPRWRAGWEGGRISTDQRPALHLGGEQMLAYLRSCTHLSILLRRASLGFLQQHWQFCASGEMINPAGAAKTPLHEMDLVVRELSGWCPRSGMASTIQDFPRLTVDPAG
jgi:hypothetical protein